MDESFDGGSRAADQSFSGGLSSTDFEGVSMEVRLLFMALRTTSLYSSTSYAWSRDWDQNSSVVVNT